ncbi:MAG TPA: hypothetical protein ENF23_02060 [Methanosarcinales archaeon]|nr:hypothetical protein [Methanosarcinales archaeon]
MRHLFPSKKRRILINPEHDKSGAYSVKEIQETHPRAYEPWTEDEDEMLTADYKAGKTIEELMGLFGRQRGGIKSRLMKLGLLS